MEGEILSGAEKIWITYVHKNQFPLTQPMQGRQRHLHRIALSLPSTALIFINHTYSVFCSKSL